MSTVNFSLFNEITLEFGVGLGVAKVADYCYLFTFVSTVGPSLNPTSSLNLVRKLGSEGLM